MLCHYLFFDTKVGGILVPSSKSHEDVDRINRYDWNADVSVEMCYDVTSTVNISDISSRINKQGYAAQIIVSEQWQ